MDAETQPETKRVRTEAQRASFLKAVETKKANAEARRLAREEEKLQKKALKKQTYQRAKQLLLEEQQQEEEQQDEEAQPVVDLEKLSALVVDQLVTRLETFSPPPEQPPKRKAPKKKPQYEDYYQPYTPTVHFV